MSNPLGSTRPVATRRSPRVGTSFSRRNSLPIGAIGLVFLLTSLLAAFNVKSLPLIGGGTEYVARFTDSANLGAGDDVRIAGVKVGEVQSVEVHNNRVVVRFVVKDGFVGDRSTVDIKLRTLLGAKYLSIDSIGARAQPPGIDIDVDRTTSPFDVYPAFATLTDTIDHIDTERLRQAFGTLSADFTNTPASVGPVVHGLSRLSTTIASRDTALHTLLRRANQVTTVLAARDHDLQTLLSDGNLLLNELNRRKDAIHALFINTRLLAVQLRGLVADNQATLTPLLHNLDDLLALLRSNEDSLDRGLSLLGPFVRVFNNVIGNGRWFDGYIQNLNLSVAIGGIDSVPAGR